MVRYPDRYLHEVQGIVRLDEGVNAWDKAILFCTDASTGADRRAFVFRNARRMAICAFHCH